MQCRQPERHTRGRDPRRGFSLLELVVVITVGGLLTAIGFVAFSQVQGRLATRTAQDNFLSLHAQARSVAVERGAVSTFSVTEAGGVVRVEVGGARVNQIEFGSEFAVEVDADGGLTQCFTPRGVADLGCTSFSRPLTVTFTRGARSSQVELLPLGQARRVP